MEEVLDKITLIRNDIRGSISKLHDYKITEQFIEKNSTSKKFKRKNESVEDNDDFNEIITMLEYNFSLLE